MSNISDAQLQAIRDRHAVSDYAGQFVALRRRGHRVGQFIGPCPICSENAHSKSAGRFECDADIWKCAVCRDGGDVIRLVQMREGVSFPEAVERLGGAREETPTPALAERAGRKAHRSGEPMGEVPAPFDGDSALRLAWVRGWSAGRRASDYADKMRGKELERLKGFYLAAQRLDGSPAAAYLAARRLLVPPRVFIRCHPAMPYLADGREQSREVHRGPAMLSSILIGGVFSGLHITWLDPAAPKGKLTLVDPETGEVLPSKKVRGSKAGGYVDLGGYLPAGEAPRRMFAGEGIETVLAVYTGLLRANRLRVGDAFRAAVDLGNLAGRATETIAHPATKTAQGRALRVPGPVPDMTSAAMPVPDSVHELVLLGDGDSDPFMTQNAMARASARHAREGREVRVQWAPPGQDFNDLI